nr:hypothetical protein [Burkholderia vietnamiensis]
MLPQKLGFRCACGQRNGLEFGFSIYLVYVEIFSENRQHLVWRVGEIDVAEAANKAGQKFVFDGFS